MVLLENTRGGTINPLSRYDSIIPSGTSGSAVAEKRRNRPRKLATTVNSLLRSILDPSKVLRIRFVGEEIRFVDSRSYVAE